MTVALRIAVRGTVMNSNPYTMAALVIVGCLHRNGCWLVGGQGKKESEGEGWSV